MLQQICFNASNACAHIREENESARWKQSAVETSEGSRLQRPWSGADGDDGIYTFPHARVVRVRVLSHETRQRTEV